MRMEEVDNEKEIKSLRSLVVRLAREIDYKNHLLLENHENIARLSDDLMKEKRLLIERSSSVSLLLSEIAEINKSLDEISAAATRLTQEKELLVHEKNTVMNILNQKQQKLDDMSADISLLRVQNSEKDVVISEKEQLLSTTLESLNKLKVEKDHWIEACRKESTKSENLELEIEKLLQDLESKTKEVDEILEKKHSKMVQETETADPPKIQEFEELRVEAGLLRKEVDEKEELLQNMEMDHRTMMIKDLRSNQELQAARRAAIEGFQSIQRSRVNIGIKRIGEICEKPFRESCCKRFHDGNWKDEFGKWEEKSMELCSLWQKHISDPAWQPFKNEHIDGKLTEVVDENDERLKELKKEWGEGAYESVVEALVGVNAYNASGRYPVSELWNFKDNRRASLGEVMQYVIKQWKLHKKK